MNTKFKVIGLTRLGIKPEFTAPEADAFNSWPSELFLPSCYAKLHASLCQGKFTTEADLNKCDSKKLQDFFDINNTDFLWFHNLTCTAQGAVYSLLFTVGCMFFILIFYR